MSPPNPESDRSAGRKKLSGVPLFLLRLFLFFAFIGAASSIFELDLSFEGRNVGLLIVLLPLGWVAALILSAWLVGMIWYNKDDPNDQQ